MSLQLFCIALALIVFGAQRLLRFLQFFQQEQYWATRFLRWMKLTGTYERIFTGATLGFATIALCLPQLTTVSGILWAALIGFRIYREGNPTKKGKVKLKMTDRAKRVYRLSIVLEVLLVATFAIATNSTTLLLFFGAIMFSASPLVLVLANLLLRPVEQKIQQGFVNQAKLKIKQVNPYIIGITGSYGKTSVKAMLGEALNTALGPTFYPQKGFNSLMGITREIREKLAVGTKYAVIEMGAYAIGSIRKSCALTPPKAAIITAVGMTHVESFGSHENIYRAKSELAQELPADGLLIVNGDNPGSRRMAEEFRKAKTFIYGLEQAAGKLDCFATDIAVSAEGTTSVIHWQGQNYPAKMIQLGKPAISNVLAAFTCACALGANPQSVITALSTIPPVSNRLEAKKHGELLYLNDAYNSNPVGFHAALEVLGLMPGTRKILMTPGMIELGETQFEENKTCGVQAAKICDIAIVVSTTNREALVSGLKQGGLAEAQIQVVDTRSQAFEYLQAHQKAGDVILIENDLPDLYESEVSL